MHAVDYVLFESESEAERDATFRAFVREHTPKAIGMAWRLCGERAAAEDIAQNAFLKTHKTLGRIRDGAPIAPWFYKILVREASNHRRWRGVRLRWSVGDIDAERIADERSADRDPGLRREILAALQTLSRSQREVFVLVHLEGFTVGETAEILGKARGTIKSHLHRALTGLRSELSELWERHRDES